MLTEIPGVGRDVWGKMDIGLVYTLTLVNVTGGERKSACPTQPENSDLSIEQKIIKCEGTMRLNCLFLKKLTSNIAYMSSY